MCFGADPSQGFLEDFWIRLSDSQAARLNDLIEVEAERRQTSSGIATIRRVVDVVIGQHTSLDAW